MEIQRYLTGLMKRNEADQQNALYRFTLDGNRDLSNIPSITNINGFRVKIEKMKKSTVVQCRRCQRFQHTAGSCSFNYRCVQCSSNHEPGGCLHQNNKNLPLQCVNCISAGIKKNTNHSANNLNACEFFKTRHTNLYSKHQTSMQQAKNKNTTNLSNHPPAKPANSSTANTKSTPSNSNNTIIETVRANNPHLTNESKKKKKKRVNNSGKSTTALCRQPKPI